MSTPDGSGGGGRRCDPLGKRALFSAAEDGDAGNPGGEARTAAGRRARAGRQALFSAPAPGPRSVTVECRRCGARTNLGVAHLALRLVPSLWRPATRYSRYMRCPACSRFGWCRLDWSVFRPL